MSGQPVTINVSLISHTNVGKTTLARTLLRRDVGEVRDAAHVTEENAGFELATSAAGDVLRLWDTPGFGDSARLLARLRQRGNPIGWLLSQVWDRFVDRPFHSSQQAVLNVREQADVVLYLVNAAEEPAQAAYVEAEMRVLEWVGKPIILLLNQLGPPRGAGQDAAEVERWREQFAHHRLISDVLPFDAFARCWVQEDILLGRVAAVLDPGLADGFLRLRQAWSERNLETFRQSMASLAAQLALAACDREPVSPGGVADSAKGWLSRLAGQASVDPALARAMERLAVRLGEQVSQTTDQLLALHGLSGHSSAEILQRVGGQYAVREAADVRKMGLLGGALSGAIGGLAADLAAGGLTLGAGALIGAVLGAAGGSGLARAYNLASGTDSTTVRWSAAFMQDRVKAAILRYLAVAHFGRGRGDYVASEYPAFWHDAVVRDVDARRAGLEPIWREAANAPVTEQVSGRLRPQLEAMTAALLAQLYPDAAQLLRHDGSLRPEPATNRGKP